MNARFPSADVADAEPPARKPRSYKWPLIVVSLLLGHVTLMVSAVVIAKADKSFTVLPEYYQKAVDWEKNQAELRASQKLGWQVTVVPSADVSPTGERAVEVTLVDDAGRPIPDALVEITAYHHARPAELIKARLRTGTNGRAVQNVVMRREGFYQVNVTATAGNQKFVAAITPFVSTAKRGAP